MPLGAFLMGHGTEIILFGSFADGKQHTGTEDSPRSDLDITFTPASFDVFRKKGLKFRDIDRYMIEFLKRKGFSFDGETDYNEAEPSYLTVFIGKYPMTPELIIKNRNEDRNFQRQNFIWVISRHTVTMIDLDRPVLPAINSSRGLLSIVNGLKQLFIRI